MIGYEVMAQHGMTQQNLADKLGISKQVMNKIIKGNKAINVMELSQIAAILGSTADSLFTVESSINNREHGIAFMAMIKDDEALNQFAP